MGQAFHKATLSARQGEARGRVCRWGSGCWVDQAGDQAGAVTWPSIDGNVQPAGVLQTYYLPPRATAAEQNQRQPNPQLEKTQRHRRGHGLGQGPGSPEVHPAVHCPEGWGQRLP